MCKHSIGIEIRLRIDGGIVPRESKTPIKCQKKKGTTSSD
ncbi:hypothetical protein A3Q56_08315 [Intoshia linei]|uniref:Uncharacterized protein n=1 Tax=Intoshia linei TaxID=1819745 RepID=A0A177AR43_9BILA|nr:hypothetical protein A3Q56_08315 [Intoshia linei]